MVKVKSRIKFLHRSALNGIVVHAFNEQHFFQHLQALQRREKFIMHSGNRLSCFTERAARMATSRPCWTETDANGERGEASSASHKPARGKMKLEDCVSLTHGLPSSAPDKKEKLSYYGEQTELIL